MKWRPAPAPINCLYVIPDIHGKYQQLELILKRILPLRKSDGGKDYLIMLGDYIDRHRDSCKVIERLIKLKNKYKDQAVLIRGNHESMFLRGIKSSLSSADYLFWMNNGGEETLAGYLDRIGESSSNPYVFPRWRIESIIPHEHLEFIKNDLVDYYRFQTENENYIFVHAGCDPSLPMHTQQPYSFWWGNNPNIFNIATSLKAAGKPLPWEPTVVIGHFWEGPIMMDKFMMLDRSFTGELLIAELRSMTAYVARAGKSRLIKLPLHEYEPPNN